MRFFEGKQKFPRGQIVGAKAKMKRLGQLKFGHFEARLRTIFDKFYHFALEREVPNFSIPPLGRDIRVTNLKGEPICIGRRAVNRGRFRLVYQKISFENQQSHAFELLDKCFHILDQVS